MIPSKFIASLIVVLAIVLMWTHFCRQMDSSLNQARLDQDNKLLPGCRWIVRLENLQMGKALKQRLFKLVLLISYFVAVSGCFYKLMTHNGSKYKRLNGHASLHFFQWQGWTVMSLDDYFRDRMNNNLGMHELMKYEWARYETFKLYPLTAPLSPLKLARAGFYYTGENQTVKCFCCGEQFDANDYEELIEAHRNCSFARGESSSNIPIKHFGRREHQDMTQFRYHSTQEIRSYPHEKGILGIDLYQCERNLHALIENPDMPGMPFNRLHMTQHNSELNTGQRQETRSSEQTSCEMQTKLAQRLLQMGYTEDRISDALNFFRRSGKTELDVNDALDYMTTTEPNFNNRGFLSYPMNAANISVDQNGSSQTESAQNSDTGFSGHLRLIRFITLRNERMYKSGVATETLNAAKEQTQPKNTDLPSVSSELIRFCSTNENKAGWGISTADTTPKKDFEEDERLKNQLTCKICMDNASNMVFIPCGHMISCETCAPHVRKCVICRKLIEGRVKAFMS